MLFIELFGCILNHKTTEDSRLQCAVSGMRHPGKIYMAQMYPFHCTKAMVKDCQTNGKGSIG